MRGLAHHLVVFAKLPRMGTVKTRLAMHIGTVSAWAFARQCIKTITPITKDFRWKCWLAISPDTALHQSNLWPKNHGFIAQGTGDLGERMARVIRNMPPGPVVIIGTDTPAIRPKHVASAFHALGSDDIVFGPSIDGGYWLLGMKRRPVFKEIFKSVNWSTKSALENTIANLPTQWSYKLLEPLEDIDEGKAFARWKNNDKR